MWDPFMVLDCTQFKENHLNAVVHTTCALTNYHCCYSLGRVGPWFSPGASAWNYLSIHEEKCSWVAVFFFFFWILIWLFLVVILALRISQNLILSLHVETRKLNLSGKLAFMSMGYGNISFVVYRFRLVLPLQNIWCLQRCSWLIGHKRTWKWLQVYPFSS